jgi:hypothetical protein
VFNDKGRVSKVEKYETGSLRLLHTNIIEEKTNHDCKWDCRVIMDFNEVLIASLCSKRLKGW